MAIDQSLEFSTAPAQMCVEISITPDAVVETDETFTVSLSSSDPAAVIATDTAEVTIVDETGLQMLDIGFHSYMRTFVISEVFI